MAGNWPEVVAKLRHHPYYAPALSAAFDLDGALDINPDHVGKALAQFQRSLISADSKYDRVVRGADVYAELEELGAAIFFDLGDEVETKWFGAAPPPANAPHCQYRPAFHQPTLFQQRPSIARLP